MNQRQPVSTRTRFEIFKRDKFACQYCGKTPPAAVLHVDHIDPVSKGGTSARENLITSCSDCNLGKSSVPLSSVIQPLSDALQIEHSKHEQLKQYNRWLKSIRKERDKGFNEVSNALIAARGLDPATHIIGGRWASSIKMFLGKLPSELIIEAVEIANCRKHFESNPNTAFKYFCGVCWHMIKGTNPAK